MSFLRPDAGRVNQPIGIRARGFLDKSAAGILPRSEQFRLRKANFVVPI